MRTSPARLTNRPASKSTGSHVEDPRVVEALEEYLGLLKQGRRPARNEFLARHQAIAAELAECLDGLEFVQSAASGLPTSDIPHVPDETLGPTTRLGDFRIIREVGRGGMGIVYEAEQLSLGRRVALKVLPFASAIDRRQRQRFQVEAEAAAQLQHAHIVPIFGVGTDRGIHYYAMQFIDGRTVALLIHELRKPGVTFDQALSSQAPDPSTEPTTAYPAPAVAKMSLSTSSVSQRGRLFYRTVAELGRQAAEALEHAHCVGVLHRDIKPANLMVDMNGHLWITDFGLARISDDVGLTRTGDILGTLRYMSPEQALGRTVVIDERTDVYSLGVTLYELLTLRPAFGASDRHVLLHQVANCEPIAPSRIDRSIPRDLETIVLKAMAKDPISRYASAKDLADDLQRFLDDKPIEARRPHLIEQAVKWSRRHRSVVVTALLLGMLGLPTATTLIWIEKGQTEKALKEARTNRESEREILRLSFLMSDGMTMRALETMTNANRSGSYDFYRQALEYYEKLVAQTGDDPSMRAMRAQMYHRIGLSRFMLGNYSSSASYEASLRLYETLKNEKPTDGEILEQYSTLLCDYAYMLDYYDHGSQSSDMIQRGISAYRQAIAAAPSQPQLLVGLARYRLRWAARLEKARRHKEAVEFCEEMERDHAALVALGRWSDEQRTAFATRFFEQAIQAQSIGNRRETILYGKLGLAIAPNHAALLNNVAWAYVCTPGSNESDAENALGLVERALSTLPGEWRYLHTKAVALFRLSRLDEAIAIFKQSMNLRNGGDANEWLFLAMAEYRLGHCDEAQEWYQKSVDWFDKTGMMDSEFARFKQETETLLEIEKTKTDKEATATTGQTTNAPLKPLTGCIDEAGGSIIGALVSPRAVSNCR